MKELTFSSEIKSSNHWKSNFCSSEFNCLFLCFSNLFIYFFVLLVEYVNKIRKKKMKLDDVRSYYEKKFSFEFRA